jgi:hypothetical protein
MSASERFVRVLTERTLKGSSHDVRGGYNEGDFALYWVCCTLGWLGTLLKHEYKHGPKTDAPRNRNAGTSLVVTPMRLLFRFGWRCPGEKRQIAHVDQGPSNSNIDNLAYLCLEHHDPYDSKTSQSKGLTPNELVAYRTKLYKYLEEKMPIPWPDATPIKGKASKQHSAQIPLELYDRRLKIYHSARNFIIHVNNYYASVKLQRAR